MKGAKNMEINKQLFEGILSGKLKGKFVFRNVHNIYGVELKPNHTCIQKLKDEFYVIRMPSLLFNVVNTIGKSVYGYTKHKGESENDPNYDIIDFILDADMKENELTIKIPEGQEIDWQESAKQEKIVFKKKDTKPRSWEEYCENHKGGYSFISSYNGGSITEIKFSSDELIKLNPESSKHTLPSKELAEAFLAMMQLMSLRQAWIGDWEPNYYMNMASNWGIEYEPNPGVFSIENHCRTNGGGLTFPTKEMATDFMNCFKDLLNVARPLI